MPEKSDMWHSVLEKLAPYRSDSREHIKFATKGDIVPFFHARLKQYNMQGPFHGGIIGRAKAGKSYDSFLVSRMLKQLEIPFYIQEEPPPLSMPVLNNRSDRNIQRVLKLALLLHERQSTMNYGGSHRKLRNIYLIENGIFGSWIYARMWESLTGNSAGSDYVRSVIAPYIPMHRAVFFVDIPDEESVRRGTKMNAEERRAYTNALNELPGFLAEESTKVSHPIALVRIDGMLPPKQQATTFLGAIAEIVAGYRHD